jgi:hypothetical protein
MDKYYNEFNYLSSIKNAIRSPGRLNGSKHLLTTIRRKSMSSEYIYYVYAYLRSKNSTNGKIGTPYYIGKGCGRRAYYKDKSEIRKPKDKKFIILMENNLSNIGALALERRYIKWYGRIDIGTGMLRNKTDGGEGACGVILTIEQRQKISKANKGRKNPKMSEVKRGKKVPKISDAKLGKPLGPRDLTKEILHYINTTNLKNKEIAEIFNIPATRVKDIRRYYK